MLEMKITKMLIINEDTTYIHGDDEDVYYKYKYNNTNTKNEKRKRIEYPSSNTNTKTKDGSEQSIQAAVLIKKDKKWK